MFIGREKELAELNRLYAAAEHDCGRRAPLPRMQKVRK